MKLKSYIRLSSEKRRRHWNSARSEDELTARIDEAVDLHRELLSFPCKPPLLTIKQARKDTSQQGWKLLSSRPHADAVRQGVAWELEGEIARLRLRRNGIGVWETNRSLRKASPLISKKEHREGSNLEHILNSVEDYLCCLNGERIMEQCPKDRFLGVISLDQMRRLGRADRLKHLSKLTEDRRDVQRSLWLAQLEVEQLTHRGTQGHQANTTLMCRWVNEERFVKGFYCAEDYPTS